MGEKYAANETIIFYSNGIVYVMALLIYGMLEYRVRSEMKKEKEAFILKGKRKLFTPTEKELLEQLDDIRVILINKMA